MAAVLPLVVLSGANRARTVSTQNNAGTSRLPENLTTDWQDSREGSHVMGIRVAVSALALGMTLVGGVATMEASAAPAHTKDGKECPVKEVKKVWYGGT